MGHVIKKWLRRAIYFSVFFGSAALASVLTISFLVQSGEEVTLPSVIGKNMEEAEHLLATRGLLVEIQRSEASDRIPRGGILSQYPVADEIVQVGRTIQVVLSKGSRERRAPRVIGLTRTAAHQVLRSSAIEAHDAAYSCSNHYGMNVVMAQDPPSGEVASGKGIGLLISTGSCRSRFLMPDVLFQSYQDILPVFYEAGFSTPLLHREARKDIPSGSIFLSKPRAGGTITPYEPIEFWVATSGSVEEPLAMDQERGELRYVSIPSEPSLMSRSARLWLRRPEALLNYAVDLQILPNKNSEFIFWLPQGSLVKLMVHGDEIWRKEY